MISRVWHGWTSLENADAYERLLRTEIFEAIGARSITGFLGIDLLRRQMANEVEFVTIMWFTSLEAVSAFAGTDYEAAVVPPAARALLDRFAHEQGAVPGGPCFGAAALDPGRDCGKVPYDQIVPAPADAAMDKADAYSDVSGGKDCGPTYPGSRRCGARSGPRDSSTHVALFGNSHAGQWLPALEDLAKKNDWQVDTYLASRCASLPVDQEFVPASNTRTCRRWVEKATRAVIAAKPDVVMMSNRISAPAVGGDPRGPATTPTRRPGRTS